jgi:hypothetical protein
MAYFAAERAALTEKGDLALLHRCVQVHSVDLSLLSTLGSPSSVFVSYS